MATYATTQQQKWAYDLPINCFKAGEVYNSDVINQSIECILMTVIGEVMFDLTYGSSFSLQLFENMTTAGLDNILNLTAAALAKFEPRITVLEADMRIEASLDTHSVTVTIPYIINSVKQIGVFQKKAVS